MNIEKITYKIVKDSIKEDNSCTDFILKMMLSYLSDEQRGSIMDEIKRDIIWFNPIDNKYDLKDLIENDIMLDSLLMTSEGYIKGTIVDDTNYQDSCSPYATEYKVKVDFTNEEIASKEIRIKRSNIIRLWKDLE